MPSVTEIFDFGLRIQPNNKQHNHLELDPKPHLCFGCRKFSNPTKETIVVVVFATYKEGEGGENKS